MPVTVPAKAPAIDLLLLGDYRVDEILYEAEEPIVFTVVAGAQTLLAYLADHNADGRWVILAPCGAKLLASLRSGSVTVRDALTSSWTWLANLDESGRPLRAWTVDADTIPVGHLPEPGLPLLPEHEPIIATRAIGPTIVAGEIPASVIAFVANGTRMAVKTLLDFILDRQSDTGGRPPDEMRALYDLPVTRFAFQSFELSFAAARPVERTIPMFGDPGSPPEIVRAAQLLQKGLAWASCTDERPLEASSDEERDAVLRAILNLTPPATGPIEQISVSGQWMVKGITILKRGSRRRVHGELRRLRTEHVVKKEGRVGELDRDRLSFILRDTGAADVRCLFKEEDYEDVFSAFESQGKVAVAGIERNDRLYVAAVLPA